MVTLVVGQLIRQTTNPGRIWKITRTASRNADGRFTLQLVEPGEQRGGMIRYVGDTTTASRTWIMENCTDVETVIEPPCGDGVQTVSYQIVDLVIEADVVDTAAEAVAFFERMFAGNHNVGQGNWWGFDVGAGSEPPDMTVSFNNGQLVWAE